MTESQNRPRIDRAEEARNCVRSGSFETFYKTYYKRLVRYLKSQANMPPGLKTWPRTR